MKNKIDWEKINEEKLMNERGVENYNYKKPLKILRSIECAFCGNKLKNNSERTEHEHLSKCQKYLIAVRDGRVKNDFGLYSRPLNPQTLTEFVNNSDFPSCVLGKIITTKVFTGRVTKISDDGEKITLTNDIGNEKQFVIKYLLR